MTGPVIAVLSIAALVQGVLSTASNWTQPTLNRLTAQRGLCVLIPCNYTAPEAVDLTGLVFIWYKDYNLTTEATVYHTDRNSVNQDYRSRTRLSGNLSDLDCSLIINDLRDGDNGTYQFRVEDAMVNYTDGNQPLDLTISDLEWKPNISYPSEIIDNITTTLNCTFLDTCGGSGPNMIWIKFNVLNISASNIIVTERDNSTSLFSTSLTFVPSIKDDGERVDCGVRYPFADAVSWQTLLLDVKYGPKIDKMSAVTLIEGDSVQVICTARSNPVSNVTWFRNNRSVATAMNRTLTLHLVNITSQEHGLYYCRAWNAYGRDRRRVNITVNYGPRIEEMAGTVIALKGESLRRVCLVDSRPESNVTWSKGGEVLSNTTSGQLTLEISSVQDTDSGVYTCRAENPYGATNRSLYIKMEYPPGNISISGPDRTPVNSSTETEEGRSLSLLCSVDSDPASNLTWKVNGKVRNATFGSNELWLRFDNVTYREDGEHQCQAVNPHGLDKLSVTVTLKYSPKETAVQVSGARDGIKEGDNVTLTCSSKSNPPPASYSWFRVDGSETIEFIADTESFNLGRVTRSYEAGFYCTAENMLGSSNSTLFNISVEYDPEISSGSSCARNAEGVSCICEARSNPPGDLTWHLPLANISGNETHGRFVAWQVRDGQLVTGSLTLREGEGEEEATVFCSVRNRHGEAMLKVYLWVKGRAPYLLELLIPAIGGAAVMFILSLMFCMIIVLCRRKAKPAAMKSTEMQRLTGQLTPVPTASLEEEEEEEEAEGEAEAGSGTEEVSEAGSLKWAANGEAGQAAEQQEAEPEPEPEAEPELHYACIDFSKTRPSDEIVGDRDSTQYAEIKSQ